MAWLLVRGISPLAPISGDWAYGSDTACHLSSGAALFEVRWEHLCLFTYLWPLLGHHGYPSSRPPLSRGTLGRMGRKSKYHEESRFFCVTVWPKSLPWPTVHVATPAAACMWCHLLSWRTLFESNFICFALAMHPHQIIACHNSQLLALQGIFILLGLVICTSCGKAYVWQEI